MVELNPNGEINAMVWSSKKLLNQQEKAKNLKDPRHIDSRKAFYNVLNKNVTNENEYGNLANKLLDDIGYIDEEKW